MSRTVTYTTGIQNLRTSQLPNNPIIRLAGTVPYPNPATPTIIANADTTPPIATYTVGKVEVSGTDTTPNYGFLDTLEAPVTIQHGLQVSDGTLWTDFNIGFTLDGRSVISDGGSLITLGGRYHGSLVTLNGSLSVGDNSTADFTDAHLTGDGTVKTTAPSATIDVRQTGGLVMGSNPSVTDTVHFDLTKGGTLNILSIDAPMSFVGQIRMGDNATVNINSQPPSGGSPDVVSEIWHTKTDVLDLLNAAGQYVAQIGFAKGTHELYAAPTSATSVAVTTHWAAGDLPVAVAHS